MYIVVTYGRFSSFYLFNGDFSSKQAIEYSVWLEGDWIMNWKGSASKRPCTISRYWSYFIMRVEGLRKTMKKSNYNRRNPGGDYTNTKECFTVQSVRRHKSIPYVSSDFKEWWELNSWSCPQSVEHSVSLTICRTFCITYNSPNQFCLTF
jgi:hypothetical protein